LYYSVSGGAISHAFIKLIGPFLINQVSYAQVLFQDRVVTSSAFYLP